MTIVDVIAELIHRRRRQILLHSIVYYNYNENIIPDATYDVWARELAMLQRNHPHISELVAYHVEAFRDFTHSVTGFNLPLDDIRANSLACWMLEQRRKNPKRYSKLPIHREIDLTLLEMSKEALIR